MTITYAIADLHGRLDLLESALTEISKRSNHTRFKIVTMGDYVDRGPNSCEVIQRLMHDQAIGCPIVCLQGNHEAMMLESIREPTKLAWWIGHGGRQTLMSYGLTRESAYDPDIVPKTHIEWMQKLPKYHVDRHRIFVHAGVSPRVALEEQDLKVLQWFRYSDKADVGYGDNSEKHVVHGHHQIADGPMLLNNRTNLDTFAWYTGRLVIGVFDDDQQGGPIDLIEIKGTPHKAR